MAQRISELMATPVMIPAESTLVDAARMMRDSEIGDVVVAAGDRPVGIVTDRDIVIRAIADGRSPERTAVSELCSGDLTTVSPDDDVSRAVSLMRDKAVRRLPVVKGGKLVGVISLGDLAIERDETSALADISAAESNQ
jgi:CBS domain-containing protein